MKMRMRPQEVGVLCSLVRDAEFENTGLAAADIQRFVDDHAFDATAGESNRKLPSASITRWLPTGRGAELQVLMTVAMAISLPSSFQRSATANGSVLIISIYPAPHAAGP